MHNMQKVVEGYICTCPTCCVSKPSHHQPFGNLQPTDNPGYPLAVVAMDFVVDLPQSTQGNTVLLTVTDTFLKWIRLILGKKKFRALEWAKLYFLNIYSEWGIPQKVILDCDA